jgi:hypothetical protein
VPQAEVLAAQRALVARREQQQELELRRPREVRVERQAPQEQVPVALLVLQRLALEEEQQWEVLEGPRPVF